MDDKDTQHTDKQTPPPVIQEATDWTGAIIFLAIYFFDLGVDLIFIILFL